MSHGREIRSIAIVVAVLLLLFATSASAAPGIDAKVKKNSIGSKQIKKNGVHNSDIKKNAVESSDIKDGTVASGDIKNETVASGDIKNGTVASGDLANGSVTASKIAPGAIAFPNSLWSSSFRNQTGAAESNVQAGPAGQPRGDGSLRLFVSGASDTAAFGDSFDFIGVQLSTISEVSYSTFNGDATPTVRPSLRFEIDPHLVSDAAPLGGFEFTTLIHEPAGGATGWETHADAQLDTLWYLTGSEGVDIGCTQANLCDLAEILAGLDASADADTQPPTITTGVYFGLGSGINTPTETAVDEFVLNGFVFDFEPTGVYLTPTS